MDDQYTLNYQQHIDQYLLQNPTFFSASILAYSTNKGTLCSA